MVPLNKLNFFGIGQKDLISTSVLMHNKRLIAVCWGVLHFGVNYLGNLAI